MIQSRLSPIQNKPYSLGAYNKIKGDQQWIRITEGCPHNCIWCREPNKYRIFGIPKIERNKVGIMDMNLLCKPESMDIIKKLGEIRVNNKVVYYHFICGIDYRFLTLELAKEIRKARFIKPYIAWDNGIDQQFKIKKSIDLLVSVGYKRKEIGVFMICNHPLINYKVCMDKLFSLMVQGVQVFDCYYDNQLSPNILPIGWTEKEIRDFRRSVRLANILNRHYGLNPENE